MPSNEIKNLLTARRRVALNGLPGIGKTELVIQFVKQCLEQNTCYKGIFWLSATSEANLEAGLFELAGALGLLGDEDVPIERVRNAILRELNEQDNWLLLLDNVDNVDLIKSIIPVSIGTRHVIITTRYRNAFSAIQAVPLELQSLQEKESSQLFHMTRFANAEAYHEKELGDLLDCLGHLPLAIVQAAAYLSENQDTVSTYIKLLRESQHVWKWVPEEGGESYNCVATVIALSFQKLKNREASVRLLCLLSFLGTDVPELLWTCDPCFNDPTLRHVFSNRGNLNKAFQPLLAYSLVKRNVENGSVSTHALVQHVVRDIVADVVCDSGNVLGILREQKSAAYWVERVVEILRIGYPRGMDTDHWPLCRVLNPHASICIEHSRTYSIATLALFTLQTSTSAFFSIQGQHKLSMKRLEDALLILEVLKIPAPFKSLLRANTLVMIGRDLFHLRKHKEAVHKYEEALFLYKEHASQFLTISRARKTGYVDNAHFPLRDFKRALAIFQSNATRYLGDAHVALGDVKQAFEYYSLTLKEGESIESGLVIGMAFAGLADILSARGEHSDAITKYTRVLEAYQSVFGEQSLNLLPVLAGLGSAYSASHIPSEAIKMHETALSIAANTFGINHPYSALIMLELAILSIELSQFSNAHQYACTSSSGNSGYKVGRGSSASRVWFDALRRCL